MKTIYSKSRSLGCENLGDLVWLNSFSLNNYILEHVELQILRPLDFEIRQYHVQNGLIFKN